MSTVIKGGTIVAADRSYVADVLVEGETIQEIGTGLKGDKTLDGSGCYVMPGGIDPHTHLDMPFMGTNSADNYDSGTARRALRRHDDAGRFLSSPADGQPLMEAIADWDKRAETRRPPITPTTCASPIGRTRCSDDMAKVVDARRHHLQAFHGLQGRADGQRRGDVRLVLSAAPNSARCRSCTPRTATSSLALQKHYHGQRHNRARGPRAFAPAGSRGRGDQSRDHARRPGGRVRSTSSTPPASRRTRRSGAPAPEGHARLWRAADPASRARRERILQQGLEALRRAA